MLVADAAAQPCGERRLVHQLARRQRGEFGREQQRVVPGDAEHQERAGIAEHRGANRLVELVDILVGETKMRSKFARFGKQRREGVGAE